MSVTRAEPKNRERRFEAHELFFSRTDRKGIILSGNDVFQRISGWSEAELVGAPHNIIRHPDMPRAAFQLVWNYLLAGRPVAAYVKNMARDGSFYWVMATIVPQGDGFLSVRSRPVGPHWEAVKTVYPIVRAAELEMEAAGMPVREVIAESLPQLAGIVQGAGFADYTAFMRAALPTELKLRDQALAGFPRRDSCAALAAVGGGLDTLFSAVDHYLDTQSTLAEGLVAISRFAEDIRMGAMNALLAATQLEGRAVSLGAVADLMGESARNVADGVVSLGDEAAPIMDLLQELAFTVSLAKVQVDMARFFAVEVSAARGHGVQNSQRAADLTGLIALIQQRVENVVELRSRLAPALAPLRQSLGQMGQRVAVLESLDVAGRIEIARIPGADRVVTMFHHIRGQLDEATNRLGTMNHAVNRREVMVDGPSLLRDVSRAADEVGELAGVR